MGMYRYTYIPVVVLALIVISCAVKPKDAGIVKSTDHTIGYVDLNYVLVNSKAGKKVKIYIQKVSNQMKIELKKRKDSIKRKNASLGKLNNKEKERKEKELRIEITELKLLKRKFEKDLINIQNKSINQIRDEIINCAHSEIDPESFLLIVLKQSEIINYDGQSDFKNSILYVSNQPEDAHVKMAIENLHDGSKDISNLLIDCVVGDSLILNYTF